MESYSLKTSSTSSRSSPSVSNMKPTSDELKKISYLFCDKPGHEMNQLNMVCLQQTCTLKGLICCMCLEEHFSHLKECLPFQKVVGQLSLKIEQDNEQCEIEEEKKKQIKNSVNLEYSRVHATISQFRSSINTFLANLERVFTHSQKEWEKLEQNELGVEFYGLKEFLEKVKVNSFVEESFNSNKSSELKQQFDRFISNLEMPDGINSLRYKPERQQNTITKNVFEGVKVERVAIGTIFQKITQLIRNSFQVKVGSVVGITATVQNDSSDSSENQSYSSCSGNAKDNPKQKQSKKKKKEKLKEKELEQEKKLQMRNEKENMYLQNQIQLSSSPSKEMQIQLSTHIDSMDNEMELNRGIEDISLNKESMQSNSQEAQGLIQNQKPREPSEVNLECEEELLIGSEKKQTSQQQTNSNEKQMRDISNVISNQNNKVMSSLADNKMEKNIEEDDVENVFEDEFISTKKRKNNFDKKYSKGKFSPKALSSLSSSASSKKNQVQPEIMTFQGPKEAFEFSGSEDNYQNQGKENNHHWGKQPFESPRFSHFQTPASPRIQPNQLRNTPKNIKITSPMRADFLNASPLRTITRSSSEKSVANKSNKEKRDKKEDTMIAELDAQRYTNVKARIERQSSSPNRISIEQIEKKKITFLREEDTNEDYQNNENKPKGRKMKKTKIIDEN